MSNVKVSKPRRSAAERETMGWRIGAGGLLLAVVGLFSDLPRFIGIGLVIAVVGGIMWGAGMARRD